MKIQLIIIFAFFGQLCFANMASPYTNGTKASEVFTSKDIDIINEKIHVTIDNVAQTATYVVEYRVKTDIDGKQVPLLFYALDFKDDFYVSVDKKEIKLTDIPNSYKNLTGTQFDSFSRYFEPAWNYNSDSTLEFKEYTNRMWVHLGDLKYFETRLSKGEHIFRVRYIADRSRNRSNWVNNYEFQYSLAPAKYWKSFGSLEIIIDATKIKSEISTNLGQPTTGNLDSIATWHFDKLPNDIFTITYIPQVSRFASLMIIIGPFGLTLIMTFILTLLHLLFIKKHRKNNYMKKYSWVVIIGSIIIPFLILLFYIYSFDLIDSVIGSEAGKYHGYTFLVMLLYPIFLAIYMTTMWKFDKYFKTKKTNNWL